MGAGNPYATLTDTYGDIDKTYFPWKDANTNATPYLTSALGSRVFNYRPGSWDPAQNCNKDFASNYKCGVGQVKTINTNNFTGNSIATFDCST